MHAFMAEAVLVEVEAVLQAHIWQATFSGKRPLTPVYAHLNCYDVHHVQPTDGPSGRRTCKQRVFMQGQTWNRRVKL